MKKILLLSAFIIFEAVLGYAQQPPSTPPPNPAPTPAAPRPTQPAVRVTRMPPLSSLSNPPGFGSPIEADPLARRQMIVQKYALPMYRKPSDKELRMVAPDPAVASRHSALLRRPDSGIFKLLPDAGCAENARVVKASEVCLKYGFPGAGNSFSFRTENYRIRHLADLTYISGRFVITGILMQAMMTDLGDVALEQLTLESPVIRTVNSFQPADNFERAMVFDNQIKVGVHKDGHLYRRDLPVVAGHTYVIRAVAYRGRVMRAVQGADYNELDYDKRRDVIAAFRVEKIDPDGSLTIVWTKLASVPSPKIKVPIRDEANQAKSRQDATNRRVPRD